MSDILVIDRNSSASDKLLSHLNTWGYAVKVTKDIDNAIDLLGSGSFGAIILNVYIDEAGIIDEIKAIYKMNPNIRIVAIGDQSSLELERQVRLAKVFFYTVRPVDPEELEAVLQRAVIVHH